MRWVRALTLRGQILNRPMRRTSHTVHPRVAYPKGMKCRVAAVLLTIIGASGPGCLKSESSQRRYDQATLAFRHGNLKEAQRLATLRPATDGVWRARFRVLTAEVLLAQGRADQALALLNGPASDDRLNARRLMLEGDGFLRMDRYGEASRVLDEAARQAANVRAVDLAIEIDMLKGRLLTITNQVMEAGRVLESALTRAGRMHDPYLQSIALNNLAVNEIREFRYDRAFSFATQALDSAEESGAERLQASALGNLAYCHAFLGNFEKAQSYSERAIIMRQREGDLLGLQSTLGALGNTYLLQGDPRKAIPYYRKALSAARELNAPSYASTWEANLSEALAEAEDWDAAEQLTRATQQHGFQDEQERVSAVLTEAEISLGREDFAQAARYLNEVVHSNPSNPGQLWEAHASLASVYAKVGQRQKAREHFEKAIRLMETARADVFQAEHRATFLSRWIRFYQNYVDLLMDEGDSTKAFAVSESSRARVLAEMIGVWLFWNDGPNNRVQAPLVLIDVELPVTIKVA